MDKKQILQGLSEVLEELINTKQKLYNLVSQPIWSQDVHPELDGSILILHQINNEINNIINIQKNILIQK